MAGLPVWVPTTAMVSTLLVVVVVSSAKTCCPAIETAATVPRTAPQSVLLILLLRKPNTSLFCIFLPYFKLLDCSNYFKFDTYYILATFQNIYKCVAHSFNPLLILFQNREYSKLKYRN